MKKNIILFVILLLISGLYFGINYLNNTSREKNNYSNIDISFNNFSYDKIKTDQLEINNNKIVYTGTGKFEQDNEKIDNFINNLKDTKVLSLVSTNKNNFDNFGVNNTGTILRLGNSEIILGNSKGWTSEQYIRLSGTDKVFLINKDLNSFLDKDFDFFAKDKNEENEENIENGTETGTGIKTGTGTETGTGMINIQKLDNIK